MTTIGIIGFGQFGQLAARHLSLRFDVAAADDADRTEVAREIGISLAPLDQVARRDIVIVAVPVQAMRAVLAEIAPHLRPGALVIDVGSVKMLPVRWMIELLPPEVDIIATHPLFGPQSARNGLAGLRLVLCPIRGDREACVIDLARRLGLEVNVTTPEEHDEEMAYVQALTHLIGRSLSNLGVPDEMLKTPSYQHLLDLCGLIRDDTFELFTAIQTMNPYARTISTRFVAEAQALLEATGPAAPDSDR
jgi:prephenate dehydrogenase